MRETSQYSINNELCFSRDVSRGLNECRFILSDDSLKLERPSFFIYFGLSIVKDFEPWLERVHPDDRSRLDSLFDLNNPRYNFWESHDRYRIKDKNNNYVEIEQKLSMIKTPQGRTLVGRLSIIKNSHTTDILNHPSTLCHPISGLFTRSKLMLDISNIQHCWGKEFTIAQIKIDKLANYVRQFGSELLLNVAQQLRGASKIFNPGQVQLYQLDTDIFVLLIVGHVEQKLIEPLFENFLSEYISLNAGQGNLYADQLSIGIVPNNQSSDSPHYLLEVSTQTRRYAYNLRHCNIAIYSSATSHNVARYSYIEQNLSRAIKYEQLSVRFHPIVSVKNKQVTSFETLVRWDSEIYGEIGPNEFIHVAEKQGLIWDLGLIVFTKACQFLKHYNERHHSDIQINVNVSVLQLLNRDLPSHFRRIALSHSVDPSSIVLELTETVMLDDNTHALNQLKALTNMGFVLSLDDFGAGMSSINSFFDFPFRQIKIDRFFALRAMNDSAPTQFLQFLISLCRKNRISIVIEGVENENMQSYYSDLGATHLQGYLYSLPVNDKAALDFYLSI